MVRHDTDYRAEHEVILAHQELVHLVSTAVNAEHPDAPRGNTTNVTFLKDAAGKTYAIMQWETERKK